MFVEVFDGRPCKRVEQPSVSAQLVDFRGVSASRSLLPETFLAYLQAVALLTPTEHRFSTAELGWRMKQEHKQAR